jgi:hypothetical protein
LHSLSFEILFFSSQKQTDLDHFLTFLEKISRNYQENSQAKPKNITLVSIDARQVAKHDQTEFQPATQTHLDNFLTFISRKFQSFSGKLLNEFQKIPNLNNRFYLSVSNK